MKIFKFLLLLGSLSLISLNFLSCEKCDHNFEIIETKEPTCTKSGYQKFKCSLCDKEKTEPILSDGHTYSEYVIIEEGNCKIDGLKQRECSKCHNIDKVKFQNIFISSQHFNFFNKHSFKLIKLKSIDHL